MFLTVSELKLVKWCQFTVHHRKVCKIFSTFREEREGSARTVCCLVSIASDPCSRCEFSGEGMVSTFLHGPAHSIGLMWPEGLAMSLSISKVFYRFGSTDDCYQGNIFSLSFSRTVARKQDGKGLQRLSRLSGYPANP